MPISLFDLVIFHVRRNAASTVESSPVRNGLLHPGRFGARNSRHILHGTHPFWESFWLKEVVLSPPPPLRPADRGRLVRGDLCWELGNGVPPGTETGSGMPVPISAGITFSYQMDSMRQCGLERRAAGHKRHLLPFDHYQPCRLGRYLERNLVPDRGRVCLRRWRRSARSWSGSQPLPRRIQDVHPTRAHRHCRWGNH